MSDQVPTIEDFVTAYPQLNVAPYQVLIQSALDQSVALLNQTAWRSLFSQAVMLDAAHSLALAGEQLNSGDAGGMQAAVGPIMAASGAGVSTSFATLMPNPGLPDEVWYSKTVYGQQFLRLRKTTCSMGVMVWS